LFGCFNIARHEAAPAGAKLRSNGTLHRHGIIDLTVHRQILPVTGWNSAAEFLVLQN